MPLRLSEPRLPRLTAVLVCLAFPAAADDVSDLAQRYGVHLEACHASAGVEALAGCKGKLAATCMETEPGGETTLGMVACTMAETRIWEDRLDAEYEASRKLTLALDEADRADFPEFASRAETLLEAQRAWIAFRDAQCRLDYAMWGSGSMRQIAGASCQLEMTADRAIALKSFWETL